MSVVLEEGCRVSAMREGTPLVSGTLRIWNQIGRATGAQAISLRIMEFASGLSPGIRNEDCDEILYAVDWEQGHHARGRWERGHPVRTEGSVSTACVSGWVSVFINGHPYDIYPDTGIYIRPGETFAIDNTGPSSVILISSQCPDPDRNPNFVEPLTVPPSDATQSEQRPLVRLADRPSLPTADRWYRVLIDEEVGSTQVTQFLGSIPPGRAPDHFHNYEEVLFILKGEGRMWTGETNTPIAPGSCIYLPKGRVHCVENTGKDELRLLGVFYPAGSPSVRYDV
ncbi:MAG TPA: cupin domain-containing protein [Pyrinomonadaceae bacterium]|nr:cupin domain-containing protein [Pyrinomonadaceae bacterium]